MVVLIALAHWGHHRSANHHREGRAGEDPAAGRGEDVGYWRAEAVTGDDLNLYKVGALVEAQRSPPKGRDEVGFDQTRFYGGWRP